MKPLWIALVFASAGAMACPYDDDAKEAKAAPQGKATVEAKAQAQTPVASKTVASKKAPTKVSDKSSIAVARKVPSL